MSINETTPDLILLWYNDPMPANVCLPNSCLYIVR